MKSQSLFFLSLFSVCLITGDLVAQPSYIGGGPFTGMSNPPIANPTYAPVVIPSLPPVAKPTYTPITIPSFPPFVNPTNRPVIVASFPPFVNPTNRPVIVASVPPVVNPTNPPVIVASVPPVVNPTEVPVVPYPIDCFDYSCTTPQYLVELCEPIDSPLRRTYWYGPAFQVDQVPPPPAPPGMKWYRSPCIECPPGYGDWVLGPIPGNCISIDTSVPEINDIEQDDEETIIYPPAPPAPY